ncbi:hypothetical protein BGZ89_001303, partial [Linnemannia elongata]
LLTSKKLREEAILTLNFSPNGQQLALRTQTSIALWDMQSDEPPLELKVPLTNSQDVYAHRVTITYSPCGQFLASTDADRIVRLWHRQFVEGGIDSWSCAVSLRACHSFITNLSWNPVVPMEFITSSRNGPVRVWRMSSDNRAVAVKMLWGTNLKTLYTADMVLDGAPGLSPTHQDLLAQRSSLAELGLSLDLDNDGYEDCYMDEDDLICEDWFDDIVGCEDDTDEDANDTTWD